MTETIAISFFAAAVFFLIGWLFGKSQINKVTSERDCLELKAELWKAEAMQARKDAVDAIKDHRASIVESQRFLAFAKDQNARLSELLKTSK